MISVLHNWTEIGEANIALCRHGLPRHGTPEKNWDLNLLRKTIGPVDRNAAVVDLGCGDGSTLKYLAALGFTNLLGLDLEISLRTRAASLARRIKGRTSFRLRKRDIVNTRLKDQSVDFAVCISVIEHGVSLPAFFKEVARILRRGGSLFLTTDYWPSPIEVAGGPVAFGLPWRIFTAEEVREALRLAGTFGLVPVVPAKDLEAQERCVVWGGREYTFLAMHLTKS